MTCYEETGLCLSVVVSKVSLSSDKTSTQKSAHMNEKGIDASTPLLPSQPLKASIQLWHWFEGSVMDFIELNSQLALEIEASVAAEWEVCPVQRPEATYPIHQNFVPIEAELVHKTILNDHRSAIHEWEKLQRIILEFTPKFFTGIRGEAVVVKISCPDLLRQGQTLMVAVETYGPLKLRENIVPTRRPRSGYFAHWKSKAHALVGAFSYLNFIPWSFGIKTAMAIEAAAFIMDIAKRMQSRLQLLDDPVLRVVRTLDNYRECYATWRNYMLETEQFRSPDMGIKRLEACSKMLTMLSNFERATLTHLNENIDPDLKRTPLRDVLFKAGGAVCLLGCIGGGAALLAGYTAWACVGGGACVVGGVTSLWGYLDPDRSTRDLSGKVRKLFGSLKKAYSELYIGLWASFYQNELGISMDKLSKQEKIGLLKTCGIDPGSIGEVGHLEAFDGSSRREIESLHSELMEVFFELYRAIGNEIIIGYAPQEGTT